MSPDEIRKQAYDQLNEARNLIIGSFSGMGIVAHPLFKKEVLEMLYQTFNRDSASFITQSFEDPPVLYPKSKTPEMAIQRFQQEEVLLDA